MCPVSRYLWHCAAPCHANVQRHQRDFQVWLSMFSSAQVVELGTHSSPFQTQHSLPLASYLISNSMPANLRNPMDPLSISHPAVTLPLVSMLSCLSESHSISPHQRAVARPTASHDWHWCSNSG
ncbi:hypothetical protein VFPPC_03451 [Pochonia chlamydosporia 170]|uniref:Uncharacterized protein n=1 Tax=Pochonia chlamydosporia 170 TaxID=1380566 RepID=A0A179G097_METCM|nr:hypothetical protein VFPPC_03451 [Pochonia chlamydosporia 170]OAQ71097.2 hypothetical protein VFPPC_03451 [Pochonia chlamydosporia 170]